MKLPKKWLLVIGIVMIFAVIIITQSLTEYLTLEELRKHHLLLRHYVETHYTSTVIIFMALYILLVTCSIPIASMLTTIGGFLFTACYGILYSCIAGTIGAIGIFLISRNVIGTYFQNRYSKQLIKFNHEMEEYGSNFLLIVRFMPLFPFFMINIIAALTTISLWTFTWTTAIGIIPDSLMFSLIGDQLNNIHSITDLISWQTVLLFALLILLTALPIFIKKLKKKKALYHE